MFRTSMRLACLLPMLAAGTAIFAQTPQKPAEIQAPAPLQLPPYAPIVRRVLTAPLVLQATIRDATRIKPALAPDVLPGTARFYVEADVNALIRGESGLAQRITYVIDLPLDSKGKGPKLAKRRIMLFARPVPGHGDQVQVVGRDGQQDSTPALDARVRGVIQQVLAADAPPAITSVGHAFHVPGALPGEGETQIFLNTQSGAPVSLQILRRPGEQPKWAVALGEIADEGAGPPARETLLWYRLACGLPRALPDSSLAAETPENAAAARADYAVVLSALGACAAD